MAVGLVDAELAALAALLAADRVPILVAAPQGAGAAAEALAAAIGAAIPPTVGRAAMGPAEVTGDSNRDVLVAGVLVGGGLRRGVRAAIRGFGLVAGVEAGSLEELIASLGDFRVGAGPDAQSRLGVVLVLGSEPPHRVVAAHYLRPVARDAGGHVQRPGPAILATWEPRTATWDHFAWGLYTELAARVGWRAGDLERAHGELTVALAAEAARSSG